VTGDADDPLLADFIDLGDPAARRRRERDEIFVAEGLVAVARLVESGHAMRAVLTIPRTEGRVRELLAGRDVPVIVAPPAVVARTVGFNLHRGVVASAVRRPLPTVEEVLARSRRIVVLEGLNDPENLGLIARSARAFGFDALVLDPTCIDPYYRRTVRVSMGEVLLMAVARIDDWPAGLAAVAAAGFETWSLTPAADADDIWAARVPARLALVLGAEGSGLQPTTMAATARRVRIPIRREVDSLNVSAAAAVAFAATTRGSP
jgi:tRNA G18 (ribose-2'-O)-methylase SpoU